MADGASVNFVGPVVNNGLIIAVNGSTEFSSGLANNGAVLTEVDAQISSHTRSGNNIITQMPSATGASYQLQVTPALNPATWTNLGASQSGTGGVLTFTDSAGPQTAPTASTASR